MGADTEDRDVVTSVREKMRVLTRSARVRRAFHSALRRIPGADRARIESFVVWVVAEREWTVTGLGSSIGGTSAALMPLWDVEKGIHSVPEAQIIFYLPVCRLFSDEALVGVAAHEMAHALQASRMRGNWHDRMQRRYTAGERDADAIAKGWGFSRHIQLMRREREEVVNPFLVRHERRLIARALARTAIQQKRALAVLAALPPASTGTANGSEAVPFRTARIPGERDALPSGRRR